MCCAPRIFPNLLLFEQRLEPVPLDHLEARAPGELGDQHLGDPFAQGLEFLMPNQG
jgi:hypothetical protein